MMYVIYNNDGSIKIKKLNEFVQQGNSYENALFVAFEDREPEDYSLFATFRLPNKNTTTVVSADNVESLEIGEKTYYGKTISLSSAETLIDGALQMNINVITNDTNKVLVGFNTYITVNKTDILPSDPVIITKAEYLNLLSQIGDQVKKYETIYKLNELPNSFASYRLGQALYVNNNTETTLYEVVLAQDNVSKTVKPIFDFKQAELKARVSAIENVIPSEASSSNKLADKDWTLAKINEEASYRITRTRDGKMFNTYSELENATTFYGGGTERIPTRNDYTYVLEDETHNGVTTKYTFQGGTYPAGRWEFDVEISETPLTDEQFAALNSGITENLVNPLKKGQVPHIVVNTDTTLGDLYSITGDSNAIFLIYYRTGDTKSSLAWDGYIFSLTKDTQTNKYYISRENNSIYEHYDTTDATVKLLDIFESVPPKTKLATRQTNFKTQNIDTNSSGITDSDTKVPSSKLVKNKLDEIREIASGLSQTYTSDYDETIATLKTKFNNGMTIYKWDEYQDDFVEIESSDDLDSLTLINSDLESQNYELDLSALLGSNDFLAIQKTETEMYLIAEGVHGISLLKNNDNILLINEDVPDRWYSNGKLYAVQTKDLTKTDNTWTGDNEVRGDTLFRGEVELENGEIKTGSTTLNILDAVDNIVETETYFTSSVSISPKINQEIVCKTALSSLLINAFQILATGGREWRITFKAASNFTITLPQNKTIRWAGGEPIWDTETTYTLVITEGIDTDYIIYVTRG